MSNETLRQYFYNWYDTLDDPPTVYSFMNLADMLSIYYPPIHSIGTLGLRLRQVMSRSGSSVWICCDRDKTKAKDGDIYLTEEQYKGLDGYFRKKYELESRDTEREILMDQEGVE